jgi:hypothetical protein
MVSSSSRKNSSRVFLLLLRKDPASPDFEELLERLLLGDMMYQLELSGEL